MKRFVQTTALFLALFTIVPSAMAYDWAWWYPQGPESGETLVITFDVAQSSEISGTPTLLTFWWGLQGASDWVSPDESTWPAGSVTGDVGKSVQSPMIKGEDGKWRITLETQAEWDQLNFVFTTRALGATSGGDWAHAPGGDDWFLPLDGSNGTYAAPDTATLVTPSGNVTWESFAYDSRNPDAPYQPDDIVNIYVMGTFNGWTNSDTMAGPDDRGVYTYDTQVATGYLEYKYYIDLGQGNSAWISDPDNPNTNPNDNNNSFFTAVRDTLPTFRHLTPFYGERYFPADTVRISGQLFTADDSAGFLFDPTITTLPITGVFDMAMDEDGWFSAYLVAPEMNGRMEILVEATDDSGRTGYASSAVAIFADTSGFQAIDPLGDAVGSGEYTVPVGTPAQVDLTGLSVTANATEDSLLFKVGYAAAPSSETRTLLVITTGFDGTPVMQPFVNTEMQLPPWQGRGVEIILASPSSDNFNPAVHNRLLLGYSPEATGNAVTLFSDTTFAVALADLEEVLGTFNGAWSIGAYSFIDNGSGSFEVDAANGGSAEINDADAYDILFAETSAMQTKMLANFSVSRKPGLDAYGRGFGELDPDVVKPGLSIGGPNLRFITRNYETVQSSMKVWFNSSLGGTLGIKQLSDNGSNVYVTGGGGDVFINVNLVPGENILRVFSPVSGDTAWSPSITIHRFGMKEPVPTLFTSVNGSVITLDATGTTDPDGLSLTYEWTADPDNPEATTLSGSTTNQATLTAPTTLGEYYFNLHIENTNGDTAFARTMFTVHADSVEPFDLSRSAPWVRDAVVYEIFPRAYSSQGGLAGITADLDRIADLGVSTIWLMPIYEGPSDHGYEVDDYFSIERDYGTFEDFEALVDGAHERGLKIVLDMVLNHSGVGSEFMQDRQRYGTKSNYYGWYANTKIPSDRQYLLTLPENYTTSGDYTYYSDWLSLPNLNHQNADLSHYLIEMCKRWIKEYDVDGFRCDVAWGVEARNPQFWQDWRRELKTLKPEIMLLAEAGVTNFEYLTDRFDMAYDWSLHHDSRNSFTNLFGKSTATGLNYRITNAGYPFPDYTYPFRFMENHDEARYMANNTATQTTGAASLLLTIPGVPLIYAGQEVGETSQRGLIGWNDDTFDLQFVYRRLIEARNMLPSLRGTEITPLVNDNIAEVYAYGRYVPGNAPVFVILNVGGSVQSATVELPVDEWGLQSGETYYMTDLLGGTSIAVTPEQIDTLSRTLIKDGVLVYSITEEQLFLDAPEVTQLPSQFSLHQNYPNPFNPSTLIRFDIPEASRVTLRVFNVLGQTVRTLADRPMVGGSHVVRFDGLSDHGTPLPSGVYFYRIEAGKHVQSRKMVLVK